MELRFFRFILLIVLGFCMYRYRYRVADALLQIPFVSKTFVRMTMKIPFIREQFINTAFRV
ncbi:hypothetical protein ACSVDA_05350 [Cytobacillus sp. Hm23]|uniref:hypothetical protein n=1 Tax=Cytobacillus sp. IB215665 TaxID=3097357 RepID=UPI002A136206|nr:hypothetical protein [Cytobacillus sp. IB215665]MDX8364234.1 hypothetical protein [Cytobacillus sp. IB215665]